MSASIEIQPIGPFDARVAIPGSKSLSNRALCLAALAETPVSLHGLLDADDTRVMRVALRRLGLTVDVAAGVTTVQGRGGTLVDRDAYLHLGNAGTATRFMTAACCLGQGTAIIDGIPRMRERPIGQLVEPLRQLGAEVVELGQPGYPPLAIHAGLTDGGRITMSPTLSSQYISALMQIGPLLRGGLTLTFDGPIISRPYVDMTAALMRQFGADVAWAKDDRLVIAEGRYTPPSDIEIEPDASNASYFLAAGAIVPGAACLVPGLGESSLQGDVGFARVLGQMGAAVDYGEQGIRVAGPADGILRGIDVDLNAMPDMAQTLAVVALFAKGPTTMRGIGNLRVKETDRIAAVQNEVAKLGGHVAVLNEEDIRVDPPAGNRLTPAAIDTYDDHRMAMAFAIAGLRSPGVVINDPGCTAKTFPDYFDRLNGLRHAVIRA